ncbi:MAG TPA: c-type cytochrome domain-containing protein [Opitutaceae bacterium]|jgi:mono/diheme cytochrome c family protein
MREIAQFLGHLHPVWVHLPIGVFLVLALLEASNLLSLVPGLSFMPHLGGRQRALILVVSAVSAVVAAALGWLLSRAGGYDGALIVRHRELGLMAAGAAVLLLLVHRVRWLYLPAFLLSFVLLVLAGHAGAKITHGSDYLTASLPPRLARLLGVAPRVVAPPRVVTLENAVAFGDVVHPILEAHCAACHGPSKSNGSLRVDSWELLTKGGKHGPAYVAGKLGASEMIRRINLPMDDRAHMPPRDKPQLNDDDIALVEWWVGAGAPKMQRAAALEPTPTAESALEARFPGPPPPDRASVLAQAAKLGPSLGILIRSRSPDGPWLDVNARPAGRSFGDRELAQLSPIAAAVQWLDLGGTAVTAAGLAPVAAMRNLERLRLDGLHVDDASLAGLSGLRRLASLNLRGTRVTDKGLMHLAGLPRLRSLYVWQTAVTPAGLDTLASSVVDPRRAERWRQSEAELGRQIAADRFRGDDGDGLKLNVAASAAPVPAK